MGWAIIYREYEIYPSLVAVKDAERGIVGFEALAHVRRRPAGHESPEFLEVHSDRGMCFRDVGQARDHILHRARRMIDDQSPP